MKVLASRSGLGDPPVFYRPGGGGMSTDLISLVRPGDQPDVDFLERALLQIAPLGHQTPWQDIRCLPFGHQLTSAGPVRMSAPRAVQAPFTDADWQSAFRSSLDRAVAAAIGQATQVGCELSGGLDSTLVATSVRRIHPAGGSAIIAGTHVLDPALPALHRGKAIGHELPDVQSLVRHAGIHRFITSGGDLDYLALQERFIAATGWISVNGVPAHSWHLHEQMASAGAQVILSGWGGDECVSWRFSPAVLDEMLARRQIGAWWRHLAEECARSGVSPWRRALGQAASLMGLRGLTVRQELGDIECLVDAGFYRRMKNGISGCERLQTARSVGHAIRRVLYHPGLVARCTESHLAVQRLGVPFRAPLLDGALLNLIIQAPWWQHRRLGWNRWLARNALAGSCPERIRLNRSKDIPTVPHAVQRLAIAIPRIATVVEEAATVPFIASRINCCALARNLRNPNHGIRAKDDLALARQVVWVAVWLKRWTQEPLLPRI